MEVSNITFADLGLSEAMRKALEKKGYGYPTTIQAEAIPHFMQWKDVIAKAPTGTGKTFAFGILYHSKRNSVLCASCGIEVFKLAKNFCSVCENL